MLHQIANKSRGLLAMACVSSVVQGVCAVLVLASINAALTAAGSTQPHALRFVACVAMLIVSQVASNILFVQLGQRELADVRMQIVARAMDARYRNIESVGAARLQSALTEYALNLSNFIVNVPGLLTNVVIVGGCLVYMVVLSTEAFTLALVVIILGSLGYHLASVRALKLLKSSTLVQEAVYRHFHSLTAGAKELRLHRSKSERFKLDSLDRAIGSVRRSQVAGLSIFSVAMGWGNMLMFAFVGVVMFVLIGPVPNRSEILTGFALSVVFLLTPLQELLHLMPQWNVAKVSGERIQELLADLGEGQERVHSVDARRFDCIELADLEHTYFHEQRGEPFSLGPVNLRLAAGSIVFLVGGNGSGKTTLVKLLVGLYEPERGRLLLDGREIDVGSLDGYRQLFSTVFSDFHLFETMLQGHSGDLDARGNSLLRALGLDHKVQMQGGAFSTTALSQGQRKRLALVVALLEDRPILVFDEWAADQDPAFKRLFYTSILPQLKAQGRTVIAATHDEQYFEMADRVIHMDSGSVVHDSMHHGGLKTNPGQRMDACSMR